MKITYDLEFLEDGHTIELISLGMTRDDGAEYYAISEEMPFRRISRHTWLMDNVMPYLPVKPYQEGGPWDMDHPDIVYVKPLEQIRDEVRRFVLYHADPVLWADYGAYDHVRLCQLFGPMANLPAGFPQYTCEIRQEWARLGKPRLPEQTNGAHHALHDARYDMALLRFLRELEASRTA